MKHRTVRTAQVVRMARVIRAARTDERSIDKP